MTKNIPVIACFPKSFFTKKLTFFVSYTDLKKDGKTAKNTSIKTFDLIDDSFQNALERMKKELKLREGNIILDLSGSSYGQVYWKPKNKNKLLSIGWEK